MFSGGAGKDKIEELKAKRENELASVPDIKIPEFNMAKWI